MIDRLKKLSSFWCGLTWLQRLWLLAPVVMWFSYWPNISFGSDSTMNYELSIVLIYAVILALVGLPDIWQHRRILIKSKHAVALLLFLVWSGVAVIWSPNPRRGVLTEGILGVICLIFWTAWVKRTDLHKVLPVIWKILMASSLTVCGLALLQMIAGTFIESRDVTGLCAGCVAGQFGFVRPNLFAIEPQFLGNMLLAPALMATYGFMKKRSIGRGLTLLALLTTLGLTLSRGAIYACFMGIVVMWVVAKGHWLNKLAVAGVMTASVVVCLAIQGALAAINPHINETFVGAVTKSINHLSMGIIDVRPTGGDQSQSIVSDDAEGNEEPVYDGYVAESTDVRVNLTKTALSAWVDSSPIQKMTGFGLGSSGTVMAEYTGSNYEKEIVQNEYVEILLERGLVGLVLFMAVIASTFDKLNKSKNRWAWSIIAAYAVQWCFFSGLPNAIHIYLIATLLLVM